MIKRATWLLASCSFLAFADLPDGPGKEIIQKSCTGCHNPDAMSGYSHTKDEWQSIVYRMGDRAGLTNKDELDTLAKYLTDHFPKVVDPNKVNVNQATAKQLETRLGFTSKEAEAIYQYREKHGDFREWGDLLTIYGVDGKKVEAAKDRMVF